MSFQTADCRNNAGRLARRKSDCRRYRKGCTKRSGLDCGVTLSIKNIFGITPASIYGDDAGKQNPNESPAKGRVETKESASSSLCSPSELDPSSSCDAGYRMPRIVTELCAARPIHIALIDGIETMAGGEGPWIRGVHM